MELVQLVFLESIDKSVLRSGRLIFTTFLAFVGGFGRCSKDRKLREEPSKVALLLRRRVGGLVGLRVRALLLLSSHL